MAEEIPWEGQAMTATWAFARTCLELAKCNPYEHDALTWVMNTLMTELWDNGFSQSEIRTAFEHAIEDMPRYAAGEEKRGQGWNGQ